MPYDLFWHGPLSAYLQFRAANTLNKKERSDNLNYLAWLVGIYSIRAKVALHGKEEYPEEPIKPKPKLTPEQEEEHQKTVDAIQNHNEEMRKLKEKQAAEFQQQILGANSNAK
ncbi:MAG TPA: hypothetical protein VHO94_04050 [Oscillospiraceae bacterium]|nr:hypothetical protein [Oscillospiraceae bacterium]